MRFFFMGSLLDADVAEIVLDRRLAPDAWQPATLEGYTRILYPRESYPVMVARPGGRVDGAVVAGLSAEDHARIVWFEEGEYDLRRVAVVKPNGRRLEAFACVTRRDIPLQEGEWSFARWRREGKPAFMDLARLWMSLYGKVDLAEAERLWNAHKAKAAGEPGLKSRTGS